MNGAGAAAISIARLLLTAGFKDITLCDRKGAIYEGRPEGMNPIKEEMAKVTNLAKKSGSLAEMLVGADVFIGVSAPGAVTTEMQLFLHVRTRLRRFTRMMQRQAEQKLFPQEEVISRTRSTTYLLSRESSVVHLM